MKKNDLREMLNAELSSIAFTAENRRAVRNQTLKRSPRMKKKMIVMLAVAIAALLAMGTALATGLIFSRQMDAVTLAEQAIEKAYGVDRTMLGFFSRSIQEQDGETEITYTGIEDLAWALGKYTVSVKDGKANAVWSHDGESTAGGFEAEAWGKEQMREMVAIYTSTHEIDGYYAKAREIAQKHGAEFPVHASDQEELNARQAAWEENAKKAAALAKLSHDEMAHLALEALRLNCGLTDEQAALLQEIEEEETYEYSASGQPCLGIRFDLMQNRPDDPDVWPEWEEKDGIYWVLVNVETGVIEDILYDPGLLGNG